MYSSEQTYARFSTIRRLSAVRLPLIFVAPWASRSLPLPGGSGGGRGFRTAAKLLFFGHIGRISSRVWPVSKNLRSSFKDTQYLRLRVVRVLVLFERKRAAATPSRLPARSSSARPPAFSDLYPLYSLRDSREVIFSKASMIALHPAKPNLFRLWKEVE